MKLAIDLDGVVFNTCQSWLNRFHPDHHIDEIYSWDGFDKVGTTSEVFLKQLDLLKSREIIVYSDVPNTIRKLEKDHEVFFLTSKSKEAMKWSLEVLRREGLGHIPVINNWVEGKEKEEYDYDYLIDDCPHRKDDGRLILRDQPWNRGKNFSNRVFSFEEFQNFVN